MKVYLIRHGKTKGNTLNRYIGTTDEPLLLEEKKRLSVCNYPLAEMVITSPLLRCRQTAELLYPKIQKVVLSELRECDFGIFENKNWKELSQEPLYQQWVDSNGQNSFPKGENPLKFRERSCQAFEQAVGICKEKKLQKVAMVVHGGTIMSIMERYAVPQKDFYQWHVKNGCGYEIEIEPKFWDEKEKVIDRIKKIETQS